MKWVRRRNAMREQRYHRHRPCSAIRVHVLVRSLERSFHFISRGKHTFVRWPMPIKNKECENRSDAKRLAESEREKLARYK